jgi:hypothetical protein
MTTISCRFTVRILLFAVKALLPYKDVNNFGITEPIMK